MQNLRTKQWFWAYLDDEGNINVKRYINDNQIANIERMPFCKGIFDPFVAVNARHAKLMCYDQLKKETGIAWRKK